MKTKNYLNLLVCLLALTCVVTVGCRKKPVNVTQLPGGGLAGNPGDVGPGDIIPKGEAPITGTGNGPGQGNRPGEFPAGPGHAGWKENRGVLEAETVYFKYDSSAIESTEKAKIEKVAAFLKSNAATALRVEGNCDERGTEEYNRALGERRALAIREYLINSGIAADVVETASFGEDKPAVPGHNEAAWKKNRRGEFVVLTPP